MMFDTKRVIGMTKIHMQERERERDRETERQRENNMSRDMRFPTMWYVRPAKPQISLRICAV